jgi:hypothetical protein
MGNRTYHQKSIFSFKTSITILIININANQVTELLHPCFVSPICCSLLLSCVGDHERWLQALPLVQNADEQMTRGAASPKQLRRVADSHRVYKGVDPCF